MKRELSKEAMLFMILALVIIVGEPMISEAAHIAKSENVVGNEVLEKAYGTIKGVVAGTVGKIIAVTSFFFGLAASIFKFNTAAMIGAFGVALIAGLGPQLIEAVVGATL